MLLGRDDVDEDALDDLDAEEREALEEDVIDSATAARTAAELDVEIGILKDLEELARRVRLSGTDRKWNELRSILLDDELVHDGSGNLRKIIIFTEHRDTLNYIVAQIRQLLGRPEAVVEIHGGIRREERRKVQELFTKDKDVQVLVATDAAGEGLNLQRAHLMVNYDLPWNPNRLEQRFGRIHRIGQKEVCHLWNLVAVTTREGAVYARLLDKVEEQRRAYEGKVFDVLGEAFSDRPLRDLLMDAIRYGEQPEVRAHLDHVIDASVSEGIEKLMTERALAADSMTKADVAEVRLAMETARARRLQPHYIRSFFLAAFASLGGRITAREPGRFEITHVPTPVRDRDRIIGTRAPILARYERVTFDREHIDAEHGPKADLIAPGHPLLDATIDLIIERHGTALKHGAVLIDSTDTGTEPRLLVGVAQEITDGHTPARTVSKRFDYVEITQDGDTLPSGPAPYLDYDPAPADLSIADVLAAPWLADDPAERATTWAITEGSVAHRTEVAARISAQVEKTRDQVRRRLIEEINYWDARALDLLDQEAMGRKLKISAATASNRARTLEARLAARLHDLELDEAIAVRPPVLSALALILPAGLVSPVSQPPDHARNTEEVDRRAIAATMAAERALGRWPTEMPHNNKGFDIMSETPDAQIITLEVKGRIEGATDVTFTKNEILMGKNTGMNFRVALVRVSPEGAPADEIRYLVDPFANEPDPAFDTTRVTKDWDAMWDAGGGSL